MQEQVGAAYLLNVETMIPPGHPIQVIKRLPAKVLMALYSIRSERQFCWRLQYDLLFRWFLDFNPDEVVFDHSRFSPNQARLLQHPVADLCFAEVVGLAKTKGWVSDEHFSVDATQWISRLNPSLAGGGTPNGRVMPHGRKPAPGVASAYGNTQAILLHQSRTCPRYGQRAPPPTPTRQFTGRDGTGDRGAPPRAGAPRIRAHGG
jgi:hypothetical protein